MLTITIRTLQQSGDHTYHTDKKISRQDGYWFREKREKPEDASGVFTFKEVMSQPQSIIEAIGPTGYMLVRNLALKSALGVHFDVNIVSSHQINIQPKYMIDWEEIDRRVIKALEEVLEEGVAEVFRTTTPSIEGDEL